jgi:hypothetical protein
VVNATISPRTRIAETTDEIAQPDIRNLLYVKTKQFKQIFADFALFAVTKIIHRKGRKERKVFRIYVKDIIFGTINAGTMCFMPITPRIRPRIRYSNSCSQHLCVPDTVL